MIKLGSNSIGKIYLGSNSIGKAYLGSNLVFQKGSGPSPSGPTLVDYIETDGTAYIDTGIKGNAPMSAKVSVTPVAPASGNIYIFGCRKDAGDTRFIFLTLNDSKNAGYGYASANSVNALSIAASFDNQTPVTIQTSLKAGSQHFYAKQAGESSYSSATASTVGTITTGINIWLFRYNYTGTPGKGQSGIKCQWCKIYSDGDFTNLIWDAVPCYYNGEYGMWDNISNSFFGNAAGSGAFTGPSI